MLGKRRVRSGEEEEEVPKELKDTHVWTKVLMTKKAANLPRFLKGHALPDEPFERVREVYFRVDAKDTVFRMPMAYETSLCVGVANHQTFEVQNFHASLRQDLHDVVLAHYKWRWFVIGLLPNMGRRDIHWKQVDEDTRKRVFTPHDTAMRRAFVHHPLSERHLLFVIRDLLV